MRWLILANVCLAVGLSACDSPTNPAVEEATASRRTSPSPPEGEQGAPPAEPQAVASADAIRSPGAYQLEGAHALAFVPGMTWEQTTAAVEASAKAGQIAPRGVVRQSRALGGTDVDVRSQILERHGGDVTSVRLTHFGDVLVGVLVSYAEPDARRVLDYAERFGQGVHGEGWVGWWLREEQRIIQSATDGSSYEVFDLAAARQTAPNIDRVMLGSWRQRYKVPPPWGYELLEEQKAGTAPPKSAP